MLLLPLLFACVEADDGCAEPSELEVDTNDHINAWRADQGMGPLELDACASEIARGHSQDMADGVLPAGHDGFEERVEELTLLVDLLAVGENVAWLSAGYPDPAESAVTGWLNSPDHYENIATPGFNLSGMGVVVDDDGGTWFTHLLVQVR